MHYFNHYWLFMIMNHTQLKISHLLSLTEPRWIDSTHTRMLWVPLDFSREQHICRKNDKFYEFYRIISLDFSLLKSHYRRHRDLRLWKLTHGRIATEEGKLKLCSRHWCRQWCGVYLQDSYNPDKITWERFSHKVHYPTQQNHFQNNGFAERNPLTTVQQHWFQGEGEREV